MKILYLCSWFRTEVTSTVGSFFAEQAAAVAGCGHEVAIAHCHVRAAREWRAFSPRCVMAHETLSGDVQAPVFRGEAIYLPRARGWNIPLVNWQFSRFLDSAIAGFGKPDVVHVQSAVHAGVFSYHFLGKKGLPFVITEHATFYRRQVVPDWLIHSVQECFDGANRSLVVSKPLLDDLKTIGIHAKLDVVPNIYDSSLFSESTQSRGKQFTFLAICYLNEKKGVDVLLKAFAIVKESLNNVRLVIGGDGPLRESLEYLSSSLGLDESVTFRGEVGRYEVAELMRDCHCVVSSSHIETFGVTLIESLATGTPVIATRSGGPEDFVREPFGKLVGCNDPEALANAMLQMATEYDDSQAARQSRAMYAKNKFSERAFCNEIVPIYESCLRVA